MSEIRARIAGTGRAAQVEIDDGLGGLPSPGYLTVTNRYCPICHWRGVEATKENREHGDGWCWHKVAARRCRLCQDCDGRYFAECVRLVEDEDSRQSASIEEVR